jgi:hypothetical protein
MNITTHGGTIDASDKLPGVVTIGSKDLLDANHPYRCVGGRRNHNWGTSDNSGVCLDCHRTFAVITQIRQAASRARLVGGELSLLCPYCKTETVQTERHRLRECPKCHEQWHLKPTKKECLKLIELLRRSLASNAPHEPCGTKDL